MAICCECFGDGHQSYDEDGRMQTDVCYHCSGSGSVDDDTDFRDKLYMIAKDFAYREESEYKKAWNESDDCDEPYWFCAAENMMSERDYFSMRVYDRTYHIAQKLSKLPISDQELLVAWDQYR